MSYRNILRRKRWESDNDREVWKHYLQEQTELERLQTWLLIALVVIAGAAFLGAFVFLLLR